MPKLRTVRLGNRGTYPEEYTDDIIALLRAHRAAFPGKCPVCIDFPEDAVAHNTQYGSNLFGGSVVSLLKQEHFPKKEKFRVILYEAVGNPSEMDASDCPNFYDIARNIGLGLLVKFTNFNEHRTTYSGGPQQETFFQRCDNLKVLNLSVSDPRTFSWATERDSDGRTRRHQGNYLRNLEKLDILMEMMDLDLTVVNDAAIAFGHSLQHFRAVSRESLLNLMSQGDPQLLRQPRIGGWNLPALRSMHLSFYANSAIYVGRFDELPCLETLSIRIKHSHRLVDAKFYSPVCLFPVWNLPRLRSLELEGTPAMFFDFDSLHHMPILENLVLSIEGEYEPIPAASVPRLSAYRCRQLPLESAEVAPVPDPMGEKWGDHWDLPRLKSLRLDGPPSWVFCIKWLEHLPSLETVYLATRRHPLPPFNSTLVHFQRLPLSSSSKYTTIPPTEASTRLNPVPDYYDYENMEDSEPEPAMVPLMESKLQSIVLRGPWVLSEHDLNKILTVYAPNLSRLVVDGIHAVYPYEYHPWHGEQFLRTVINAIGVRGACGDGAGRAKEVQAEESSTLGPGIKSGSKLKYLASAYSINSRSILDIIRGLRLTQVSKRGLGGCLKQGSQVLF